jgi:hypothetical protein
MDRIHTGFLGCLGLLFRPLGVVLGKAVEGQLFYPKTLKDLGKPPAGGDACLVATFFGQAASHSPTTVAIRNNAYIRGQSVHGDPRT